MFEDYSECSASFSPIASAVVPDISVRSFRVNPLQGGAWCIPSLHPDIPAAIGNESMANRALAQFGVFAHDEKKVRILNENLTTIERAIANQWEKYANRVKGNDLHEIGVSLEVETDAMTVSICSPRYYDCFAIKATVERFNTLQRGLGWWMFEVMVALKKWGYPISDPETAADNLQTISPCGDFTDADMLKEIKAMGEVTTMKEARENYSFWPSDLTKDYGGHTWMFNAHRYDRKTGKFVLLGKRPQVAKDSDAEAFLRGKFADADKQVVADFLTLTRQLQCSGLSGWTSPVTDEPMELVGTSCMIVWDSRSMSVELLAEAEELLQNCGDCTDIHQTVSVSRLESGWESELFNKVDAVIQLHDAVNGVLRHFTLVNDND